MPINARKITKRYPDGSFEIMSGEIIRPPKHVKTPPPPPVMSSFKNYKDYKEAYSDYSKRWGIHGC